MVPSNDYSDNSKLSTGNENENKSYSDDKHFENS